MKNTADTPQQNDTPLSSQESSSKQCNVVILNTGIPSAKDLETHKSSPVEIDTANLSASGLSQKYGPTYSSWKNMKQRKKKGAIIDPQFDSFRDFLSHMGPRPSKSYTLDRIDHTDPLYSPEKCRWADKYTQNSNRKSNINLTLNGKTHTVAQWARLTNQTADTLYKRVRAGWSDKEVIQGTRSTQNKAIIDRPWPRNNTEVWESRYADYLMKSNASSTPLQFFKRKAELATNYLRHKVEEVWYNPYFKGFDTPEQEMRYQVYVLWSRRLDVIQSIEKSVEADNKWGGIRKSALGISLPKTCPDQSCSPQISDLQELVDLPKEYYSASVWDAPT